MTHDSTTQRVLFEDLFSKPVVAAMDLEHSSSDGGALLLKAVDARLGLTASLAADPIHKLLLGRDPIEGEALASQPTLSRFENAAGARDLYRMAERLADAVIDRHRRRLGRRCRRITLDFDPTDDPTHGQQELSFFHGYYDTYCYLPLVGTLHFNDEAEQYLL